ncbi:hypothetical protein PHLCEN_2v10693 [Hermanssonia centrifuga]|uniref:Uncharacterized protein n=1 Tax=Hermanssonia centrifuga TaxID=98765 RepID=A0A2R6NM06_9APHY|nr:hypothetical protein PHLCEN_2v10693 [Hermanssonia centrifuga]
MRARHRHGIAVRPTNGVRQMTVILIPPLKTGNVEGGEMIMTNEMLDHGDLHEIRVLVDNGRTVTSRSMSDPITKSRGRRDMRGREIQVLVDGHQRKNNLDSAVTDVNLALILTTDVMILGVGVNAETRILRSGDKTMAGLLDGVQLLTILHNMGQPQTSRNPKRTNVPGIQSVKKPRGNKEKITPIDMAGDIREKNKLEKSDFVIGGMTMDL